MVKDDSIYIRHIYEFALLIDGYMKTATRETFDKDIISRLGLVHLIQNIGEAAKHLSADCQSKTNIPWDEVIGMRNRIVHEYIEIDYDTVYLVVTIDIPYLIKQLESEHTSILKLIR